MCTGKHERHALLKDLPARCWELLSARGTDRSAVVAGEQKLVLGKRSCKTGCRFKPKIRHIAPGCSTALWNVVNENCLLTSAGIFDTYHRKKKSPLELRIPLVTVGRRVQFYFLTYMCKFWASGPKYNPPPPNPLPDPPH